jgi:hypothetical protein
MLETVRSSGTLVYFYETTCAVSQKAVILTGHQEMLVFHTDHINKNKGHYYQQACPTGL